MNKYRNITLFILNIQEELKKDEINKEEIEFNLNRMQEEIYYNITREKEDKEYEIKHIDEEIELLKYLKEKREKK